MTGPRSDRGLRPFGPGELDDVAGLTPDELTAETRVARDLEALGTHAVAEPAGDFVDRVMAAVAAEPLPAPARAAGSALRRGALAAFLWSVRDAWRVMSRPGFPMAVRAQALALVLVVAGLVAGSGMATAGALGLFGGDHATPSPAPTLVVPTPPGEPSVVQPPSTEATPSPSQEPGDSAEPTATEDVETPEPTGPEEDDTGDRAGGGGGGDGGGATATKRPSPTRTPSPTSESHDSEDHTSSPTHTPRPSETPVPTGTQTPSPTSDD